MKAQSGHLRFFIMVILVFFSTGLLGALVHHLLLAGVPVLARPWPAAIIAVVTSLIVAWPGMVLLRRVVGVEVTPAPASQKSGVETESDAIV
jgi:hypothetical protein